MRWHARKSELALNRENLILLKSKIVARTHTDLINANVSLEVDQEKCCVLHVAVLAAREETHTQKGAVIQDEQQSTRNP